jgi:Concanavalin A-like lectin/glucanases superfamily
MRTLLVKKPFMGVMPIPSTLLAALYTVCALLVQLGSSWGADLAIIHGNARLGDSIGFRKAGLALSPSLSFDPDRPFSFATWFLAGDIIGRPQAILDTRDDSKDQHGFVLLIDQHGQIQLRAKALGRKTQTLVSDHDRYDNNIWHHLAFTVSSRGTVSLYINGLLQAAHIQLHSPKHLYSNSTPSQLGNAIKLDAHRFNVFHGRMDEIQHWTAELGEPSIRENMCDVVHRRDRPLKTVSIRLGAYVSKGNLYCYGRFLSGSLDILSVRRGQLFERPLGGAQMQDILRLWSSDIKLWTKSQATMLPQDYQHRYPGRAQDISEAQLMVPPGAGPVHSRFRVLTSTTTPLIRW